MTRGLHKLPVPPVTRTAVGPAHQQLVLVFFSLPSELNIFQLYGSVVQRVTTNVLLSLV